VRAAFVLAAVGWLAALSPWAAAGPCAPNKAVHSCCATMKSSCCHAGDNQAPVPDPSTGSAKAAPEHPAELAGIHADAATPSSAAGAWGSFLLPSFSEAAPIYLSTCTFRC
jgi:hypothetical protein